MATYTARLEREADGRWTVELAEEPRVHTWGKTIDQALNRMREAAAMWFETDEASIDLVPSPVLPKTILRTVEQAGRARTQARNADRVAVDKTRQAAIELARRGISHARRPHDPGHLPPAGSTSSSPSTTLANANPAEPTSACGEHNSGVQTAYP